LGPLLQALILPLSFVSAKQVVALVLGALVVIGLSAWEVYGDELIFQHAIDQSSPQEGPVDITGAISSGSEHETYDLSQLGIHVTTPHVAPPTISGNSPVITGHQIVGTGVNSSGGPTFGVLPPSSPPPTLPPTEIPIGHAPTPQPGGGKS